MVNYSLMKKFFITTPIYYMNDSPHIGHSYTTVAADVLARWNKLLGKEVYFLTGSDEHGQKIFDAAKSRNRQPKEFCDEIVEKFKAAWGKLNISYDKFIRTTDPVHEETVNRVLSELFKQGGIYKSNYRGNYCVQCEKYLVPSELEEGLCPDHKIKPVEQTEENYFFKLSGYRDKLIEIISDKNHPEHFEIAPEGRKNEILGKLKVGLEDISISRANMPWGIPLPFDKSQTTYVWVDALMNYISAAGYVSGEPGFEELWPADVHLMAKDILWFHSVIWPAVLMSLKLKLPGKVYAHGFFTVDAQKMSKTIGNVIAPDKLIDEFGVDAARYLLLAAFPFGTDGDFSLEGLKDKYNTELANNIGNLVARVTTMVNKYAGGVIPGRIPSEDRKSAGTLWCELSECRKHFENLDFHRVLETVQKTANSANSYIEEKAPWNMAKAGPSAELNNILFNLCETIWVMSHYIYPFMPEVAGSIWSQLGQADKIADSRYLVDGDLKLKCNKINRSGVLFPRLP